MLSSIGLISVYLFSTSITDFRFSTHSPSFRFFPIFTAPSKILRFQGFDRSFLVPVHYNMSRSLHYPNLLVHQHFCSKAAPRHSLRTAPHLFIWLYKEKCSMEISRHCITSPCIIDCIERYRFWLSANYSALHSLLLPRTSCLYFMHCRR